MTKIRYSIIRLDVTELGEIIEISHKLPAHLKLCTGFNARHTKGLDVPKDLDEIGLLALEFNSRKQLFVNALIGYQSKVEALPEYQDIHIPLENGHLVTGYYMDTEQVAVADFKPYTVSIYLRCELDIAKIDKPCTTI